MSKAAELAALIGSQTALSNRNLVINGAMQVAQRGTSASVSNDSNEGYQTLDRWYFQYGNSAGGTVTVSQDSTVPSGEGFANSYKVDVTSADTSLASNHNVYIGHTIESQNMANSGWNYTDPNSFVTLSFYARSSVDTTLCFMARNFDAGYYYVKEFSLTANTWKRVSHAIPGNANLVFNDDNGEGLGIWIILATGSDNDDSSDGAWNSSFELATSNQANFLASTSNILHLTGVQLEVGEQATPFEHRSFGDELLQCQRYYYRVGDDNNGGGYHRYAVGSCQGTSSCGITVHAPVKMRTTPTLEQTGTASNYALYEADSVHACSGVPAINSAHCSPSNFNVTFTSSGNLASGNAAEAINNNNTTSYLAFSAEL
jgi:hypothetical protein